MLATPACDSLAIMLTRTDYSDVAGVLFGALGALEQWPTPPAQCSTDTSTRSKRCTHAWSPNDSNSALPRAEA